MLFKNWGEGGEVHRIVDIRKNFITIFFSSFSLLFFFSSLSISQSFWFKFIAQVHKVIFSPFQDLMKWEKNNAVESHGNEQYRTIIKKTAKKFRKLENKELIIEAGQKNTWHKIQVWKCSTGSSPVWENIKEALNSEIADKKAGLKQKPNWKSIYTVSNKTEQPVNISPYSMIEKINPK